MEQQSYTPSSRSPNYVKGNGKKLPKKRIDYLEYVKKLQAKFGFEEGPFLHYIERRNSLINKLELQLKNHYEPKLAEFLIYLALKKDKELYDANFNFFEALLFLESK